MGVLTLGTLCDLRRREIPDAIPLALLGISLVAAGLGWSPHGSGSLALGLVTGFTLGALLWWRGGFGGGDVKVLAALGALVGLRDLFSLLFYVALAGAILAVVAVWRGQRDFAYAPAIAIGFLIFLVAGAPL
jgi:Flp pilus assembly protein protease CpaA